MVSWNSIEIKDTVSVNGKVLGLFECVTYSICGYRIYSEVGPATNSSVCSSPTQFLLVYESKVYWDWNVLPPITHQCAARTRH